MSSPSYTILIVEDIYFNQMLIDSFLVDWGYRVLVSSNGAEGLEMLKSNQPDLIILDLMMPGMDGYQFLQEKRKLKNSTPVLVLTAMQGADIKAKCLSLGALDFIPKPMDAVVLQRKIEAILPKMEEGL